MTLIIGLALCVLVLAAAISAYRLDPAGFPADLIRMALSSAAAISLPFLSILIFTQGWSDKSINEWFLVEPRRHVLLFGKFCASIAWAIACALIASGIYLGAWILGTFSASSEQLLRAVLFLSVTQVLTHCVTGALGSLLRSTALASVMFLAILLVLPMLYFALAFTSWSAGILVMDYLMVTSTISSWSALAPTTQPLAGPVSLILFVFLPYFAAYFVWTRASL